MTENIVALASHPRKVVETKLDKMVAAINREFERAQLLDNKACHARVAAGQMLIELRAKIEAGEAGRGVDWWQWYDSKFERSRRDAEKCMALAIGSMDPEAGIAAIEDERRRNREARPSTENESSSDSKQPSAYLRLT